MAETYTTCPICRERIEPEAPDAVLAEKVEDHPGFGQAHDYVWSRVGFAHEDCLRAADRFRAAA